MKNRTLCVLFAGLSVTTNNILAGSLIRSMELEEIIVTAQKRKEPLQDIPIAISVLNEKQLMAQRVSSLGDMISGVTSSLTINPFSNASTTLAIAIRGNGTGDVAQSSRDANVAVYLDEVYLGRAQGLDFELAELKRIEVLRGPQGTLYGRNATAGAINLVSKRPSGELEIRQSFNSGTYDLRSSSSHIDLPQVMGVSTKIDYLYSKRDGWVDNTDQDESDYNAFGKRGYRLSVDAVPMDDLRIEYTYNNSDVESTQQYYQLYNDFIGIFGEERKRAKSTRLPVTTLDPTITEQEIHSINARWNLSDHISVHSISSYRELDDKTRNNFGGVAYFNGVMETVDVEQEQISQELRLVGNHERFSWVTGMYYYDEKTNETIQQFFSLDIFGLINTSPLTPIDPPTNFDILATNAPVLPRNVVTELESSALYGQITWTPEYFYDHIHLSLGVRHTRENKSGAFTTGTLIPFDINSSETDPTLTIIYKITEDISTYFKRSTGHRSGGVSSRSLDMLPFDTEEVTSKELGLKALLWDRRMRVNIAAFKTDYDGMFIDIFDPNNLVVSNTINANNKVEVDGAELEFWVMPLAGLTLSASYTYLDGSIPNQPNPLAGGTLEPFLLTQTPKHAGSFAIDYELPPLPVGILSGHLEVVSSAPYHHWPSGGEAHPDGHTIFNASINLAELPLSADSGTLGVSMWIKNLTDAEYVISSTHFEGASTMHSFGEPRTAGIEVKLEI